jgi:mRNA-degrading endonuclease toxin of MazEF toxin-antitoxin module
VVSCDNLVTVPKARLSREPIGVLTLEQQIQLDQALRYALDIAY